MLLITQELWHCVWYEQYERTAAAVYDADGSVETLLELLQIYREKGADIFMNICMLLGIMGFDDYRRQVSFRTYMSVKFIVSHFSCYHI